MEIKPLAYDVAPLVAAIKEYDKTAPARQKLWDSVESNDDVFAAEKADQEALDKVLPHGHRANQLIQAIKDNLSSKMFKAAKMSRRLDKRFVRLSEQAHKRCHKIAYSDIDKAWPKDRLVRDRHLREEFLLAREKADAMYEELFEARREVLLKRLRKVSSAASPGLQGCFTEAVAKFLYNHLPIH